MAIQMTPKRFKALSRMDFENGAILDDILAALTEAAQMRADLAAAAGECLVEVPEPGTPMAKLLSANVLMREENDDLRRGRDREVARLRERERNHSATSERYKAIIEGRPLRNTKRYAPRTPGSPPTERS